MMRSAGFRPEIAAGVEAAASSGGALVPPVMGAGAYMMLEIVDPPVTYLEIIRAALIPAIIYGLTHTRLGFLPPAEPFWGRAVAMTLVGCCWGWAFLRYDALTVVLSHYTADLFIFNWPRLASGESGPTTAAVLTIMVPLVPGLLWLARRTVAKRE